MYLSEKAKKIEASITLSITAKAKQMKSEGINVIGFGAGEPDFDTPDYIKDIAIEAIKKGFTKYTPASGLIELKQAITEKLYMENRLNYDVNQIVVSNGAKHSLFNTFQAILNPGDQVLIPTPYWVSYPELVKLADGLPVFVATDASNNFRLDIGDLKRKINNKTRAIIINSPSNPMGTVYSKQVLEEIADIAVKHGLYVISDEIYEKIIYDKQHYSIASFGPDIKDLTITINGMSKAYSMTGWRIGYAAANEEIVKVMANIQSHATSNPNSIAQYASIAALKDGNSSIKNMVQQFKERRDYIYKRINAIPGLSSIKPQGAFYILMDISSYINKKIKGTMIKNSIDFSNLLLDNCKVAVVPGIAFGNDNYVRLSYATSYSNIKEGLDRIEAFLQ